ncbi:MAG: hypothetical protein U9N00_00055, partial [Candidatus Bipolaricaulota bacterium]|nr:hypothetical protein [Candidatus Bipolaricaulota bacterium]
PPDPAWAIVIPTSFGKVGFWLNSPYNPKGHYIHTGGHYFTCQNRNWDMMRHCFIFEFSFTPGDCPCVCGNYGCKCDPPPSTPGTTLVPVLYVLVWEDWCGLEERTSDWNDFVVGLIPSNIKVGPDLH